MHTFGIIMACTKLSSELQQLLGRRSKTIMAASVAATAFRHFSSSSDDDECKKPVPKPEPRPDLTMKTHTHQVWAEDDYRNVRFMNAKRWVNKNFPIHFGHACDVVYSSERVISCSGEAFSHPIVFINLDKPGFHSCIYCGQKYSKKIKTEDEKVEIK